MASRDERLDNIPEMIASGMTYDEIAADLGVTKSTVASVASAHGFVRSRWAEARLKIAILTEQGLSSDEIAKELGCSVSLVRARWSSIPSISNKAKRQRRLAEIEARKLK